MLKCSSVHHSSRVRVQFAIAFSSTWRRRLFPVTTDVKWVETNGVSVGAPVFPAKTHPNTVSRAVGLLSDPDRRPLRSTSFQPQAVCLQFQAVRHTRGVCRRDKKLCDCMFPITVRNTCYTAYPRVLSETMQMKGLG